MRAPLPNTSPRGRGPASEIADCGSENDHHGEREQAADDDVEIACRGRTMKPSPEGAVRAAAALKARSISTGCALSTWLQSACREPRTSGGLRQPPALRAKPKAPHACINRAA